MSNLMKIATVGIGHIGGLQGFKKILKGGGIAGGGAALYGALVLSGLIPTDMPDAIVAFAVAALSAGINFLKIWLLKFDIQLDAKIGTGGK